MASSHTQHSDPMRMNFLREAQLLDPVPQECFDRPARLARGHFNVPAALVIFLDQEREFYKARVGWENAYELARAEGFAADVVASEGLLIIPDTTADPFYASRKIVTEFGVRFFAAAPLVAASGDRVGAFAVLDIKPRDFSTAEALALEDLAALASDGLQALLPHSEPMRIGDHILLELLNNSDEFIWELDAEGIFVSATKRTFDVLGYPTEEMRGRAFSQLLHESYRDYFENLVQHMASTGQAVREIELCLINRQAEPRWLKGAMMPVHDGNGALRGYRGVCSDVTRSKTTEMALRQAEDRYRKIFEGVQDGIYQATMDGEVLDANPALANIFGYDSVAQLVSEMNANDVYESPERRADFLERLKKSGSVRDFESRVRSKDGEILWVQESARIVAQDKHEYIESTVTDTTLRRAAEESLKVAKDSAEAANAAKSDFLANMSHEIRTPLNAVVGLSSLLLESGLTHEQEDHVHTIRHSADALLNIINDVLDFSKIESGKLELEKVPFELRHVIEEAIDYIGYKAGEKRIALAYLLDATLPKTLVSDITRVRQILANLLSNAIKFTETGEVVLEAAKAKTADGHGEEILFMVRDTGIGIPQDKLDCLFQAFSQTDASTTRKYGGTGLGLAISKHLTELMGGRIWVESKKNEGTTFFVQLPIQGASAQESFAPDRALLGKRLLIAHDNAAVRRMISDFAQRWGMYTTLVTSSKELDHEVQTGTQFDIAVIDTDLPDDGGIEAGKRLQQHRRTRVALILTANVQEHAQLSRQLPEAFAACLPIPVHYEQLHDVLAQAVTGRKITRKLFRSTGKLDPMLGRRAPLSILIAEDNAVNQKVVTHLLTQMGYRPDVAQNGQEVLRALARQTYDLVLMDVQMPDMDGLETTQQIRATIPQNRQPYIIATTANAMPGDSARCLESGMDAYLPKPIRVEALQTEIAVCAKARHQVIDDSALEQFRALRSPGEPDPLLELIDIFLEDTPALVRDLIHNVQRRDPTGIARHAHTLKGSSANFGARELQKVSTEIERLSKAEDLTAVDDLVETLRNEFEEVCQYLEKMRQTIQAEG